MTKDRAGSLKFCSVLVKRRIQQKDRPELWWKEKFLRTQEDSGEFCEIQKVNKLSKTKPWKKGPLWKDTSLNPFFSLFYLSKFFQINFWNICNIWGYAWVSSAFFKCKILLVVSFGVSQEISSHSWKETTVISIISRPRRKGQNCFLDKLGLMILEGGVCIWVNHQPL